MSRWRRLVAVLCLGSCLLAVTLGPALAGRTAAQPETDNTVTRIQVHANGSATWTIRIRTRLTTDEEVANYRTFQRQFRNNTTRYLDPFSRRMTSVVDTAENATGREMAARQFSASTSIQQVPRRWGVVSYRFTWTAMARETDRGLVLGDVFRGGLYLAENDTLVVAAPTNYTIAGATPEPTESSATTATWVGERSFADERPRVRFAPADTPEPAPRRDSRPGATFWWVVAALFAGGAAIVYALIRAGYLSRPAQFARGGATEPAGEANAPATEPTEALLTDADRVERLLREHGGRLRQTQVADELDWSASKTSRVVSDMAEQGRVEKLRLGRENVLELTEDQD